MNVFRTETKVGPHPLGMLSEYATSDGSLSLYSSLYKEAFHSRIGAHKEAQQKFIIPSEINRFEDNRQINVLDVCLGLGYNSGCLFEEILETSLSLNWFGIEIDKRPLDIALESQLFQNIWSPKVVNIFDSLKSRGKWSHQRNKGSVVWEDARQGINYLPKMTYFDIIFLDAFSPNNCPQLWTEEFLTSLSSKLAPGGRLLTYCRGAAIRSSLRKAGLQLKSLLPDPKDKKSWTNGTLAILPEANLPVSEKGLTWQPLTTREEEHLLTKASVPYRDPTGKDSSIEILNRRKLEQRDSTLEATNSWQKRWMKIQNVPSQ